MASIPGDHRHHGRLLVGGPIMNLNSPSPIL
jgi:hypothetical protein